MITKIFHDRHNWPEGPWAIEPDFAQWYSQAGDPCAIIRNDLGAWCGYVGVSPGHPYFDKDYSEIEADDLAVHGGLTFAGFFLEATEEKMQDISMVIPGPNGDTVWWFGFDCLHGNDIAPGMIAVEQELNLVLPVPGNKTYRDMGYAIGQVNYLAQWLIAKAAVA